MLISVKKCQKRQKEQKEEIDYHIPKELYAHNLCGMLVNKKKREFIKITSGMDKADDCDEDLLSYYKKMLDNLLNIEEKITKKLH